jgi:hypothetical protein
MKKKFIDKNFAPATLKLIDQANNIIAEYLGAGMRLTLRQLYYQFVSPRPHRQSAEGIQAAGRHPLRCAPRWPG